jgi:hypothetical protein
VDHRTEETQMNGTAIITVNTKRWNESVEVINPIKPDTRYLFIGRVDKFDHTLAVAEGGTGATRFYCEVHKIQYRILDRCPECTIMSIDELPIE